MKLLTILCLLLGTYAHDIQVAIYKIHMVENDLVIDFTFEYEDLPSETRQLDSLSGKEIHDYISQHFSVSVNQKICELNLGSPTIKGEHLRLTGHLLCDKAQISNIAISNTCFLHIDGQSNVVSIHLKDQQRDFLMNANRTKIAVDY